MDAPINRGASATTTFEHGLDFLAHPLHLEILETKFFFEIIICEIKHGFAIDTVLKHHNCSVGERESLEESDCFVHGPSCWLGSSRRVDTGRHVPHNEAGCAQWL